MFWCEVWADLLPDRHSALMKEDKMSDEEQDLTDEEQMAIAIDWFIAMWDEAINRGVGEEAMGMISLSATTNKLINVFGEEGAAALLQRTVDNVKAGQFDVDDSDSNAAN
jgi:hypothetical protein